MTIIKTTDVLLETFPRSIPSPMSCEVWKLYHRANVGYFVVDDIDTSKLSPEDLEAFLEPVNIDEPPSGWGDDMDPALFPTIDLAKQWAKHEDAMLSAMCELDAFHAPSECGTIVYGPLEQERNELLSKTVH